MSLSGRFRRGSIVVLVALGAACSGRASQSLRLTGRSGTVYEAYALKHVVGKVPGFRDSTASRYLLVGYYTTETDVIQLDREAEDLLPALEPVAAANDEEMIVIEQARPLLVRGSGVIHGSMVRFARNSAGKWNRDE